MLCILESYCPLGLCRPSLHHKIGCFSANDYAYAMHIPLVWRLRAPALEPVCLASHSGRPLNSGAALG